MYLLCIDTCSHAKQRRQPQIESVRITAVYCNTIKCALRILQNFKKKKCWKKQTCCATRSACVFVSEASITGATPSGAVRVGLDQRGMCQCAINWFHINAYAGGVYLRCDSFYTITQIIKHLAYRAQIDRFTVSIVSHLSIFELMCARVQGGAGGRAGGRLCVCVCVCVHACVFGVCARVRVCVCCVYPSQELWAPCHVTRRAKWKSTNIWSQSTLQGTSSTQTSSCPHGWQQSASQWQRGCQQQTHQQ